MAKFYFKASQKEEHYLVPKRRTIDFLLNYSKSLRVVAYNEMKFETTLN